MRGDLGPVRPDSPVLVQCSSCSDNVCGIFAAMILVPTRELALQTAHVLKDLGKFLNLQIMTSTGGTDLKDDVMRLSKTVHIIVATPGRIHDLGQKGIAKLGQCSHLVMDEVRAYQI